MAFIKYLDQEEIPEKNRVNDMDTSSRSMVSTVVL
jgi:hypothetical protein